MLSRNGVYIKEENDGKKYLNLKVPPEDKIPVPLFLGCCRECLAKLYADKTAAEAKKGPNYYSPPVNAIVNGHWIGNLPTEFKTYTRSDEQCLALMQACVYLSTIISNPKSKKLCSHGYIIKNPDAIINCIPKDVTGVVRMTLVGAFTPLAEAETRKRYTLNHEVNKKFLNEFLMVKNVKYMEHEEFINRDGFKYLDKDAGHIVDRCDGGANPVNPKLIKIMEFDHTSHHNDNGRSELDMLPRRVADHQIVEEEDDNKEEDGGASHRTRLLFTPPDVFNDNKVCLLS